MSYPQTTPFHLPRTSNLPINRHSRLICVSFFRIPSWDSAFAPVHSPSESNLLLSHSPLFGFSNNESSVFRPLDRSYSSPVPSASGGLSPDTNAPLAVDVDLTHLEPLRDLLQSPSDISASAAANRWKTMDETRDTFQHQLTNSSLFTHYFYELPQITMARRISMLKHEGRQDDQTWLNPTSSPLTVGVTTDKTDQTALIADETVVSNTPNKWSNKSAPEENHVEAESRIQHTPRKCKRTQSESHAYSESPLEIFPPLTAKKPSRLSESIETKHPSPEQSSVASNELQATRTSVESTLTPYVNLEPDRRRMSDTVVYRPWKPLDAISRADLFMDLGVCLSHNFVSVVLQCKFISLK